MLPATLQDLERVRDECKTMVTQRAGLSAGASVVPIPGMDVGADVMLLLDLIPSINKKFGLAPEQIDGLNPKIKQIILMAAANLGSQMIGKFLTKQIILQVLKRVGIRVTSKQVLKYIPILGQAMAATISFSAMRMIGNSHVDDCYEVAKRALNAQSQSVK